MDKERIKKLRTQVDEVAPQAPLAGRIIGGMFGWRDPNAAVRRQLMANALEQDLASEREQGNLRLKSELGQKEKMQDMERTSKVTPEQIAMFVKNLPPGTAEALASNPTTWKLAQELIASNLKANYSSDADAVNALASKGVLPEQIANKRKAQVDVGYGAEREALTAPKSARLLEQLKQLDKERQFDRVANLNENQAAFDQAMGRDKLALGRDELTARSKEAANKVVRSGDYLVNTDTGKGTKFPGEQQYAGMPGVPVQQPTPFVLPGTKVDPKIAAQALAGGNMPPSGMSPEAQAFVGRTTPDKLPPQAPVAPATQPNINSTAAENKIPSILSATPTANARPSVSMEDFNNQFEIPDDSEAKEIPAVQQPSESDRPAIEEGSTLGDSYDQDKANKDASALINNANATAAKISNPSANVSNVGDTAKTGADPSVGGAPKKYDSTADSTAKVIADINQGVEVQPMYSNKTQTLQTQAPSFQDSYKTEADYSVGGRAWKKLKPYFTSPAPKNYTSQLDEIYSR